MNTRRQISLHRKILIETFGGTSSKGVFPPENAFSTRMIPALVDEGFAWVLVDNIHFDRANQDYPWTKEQIIEPPNPADARNPAQPHYFGLTCQQNTQNQVSTGSSATSAVLTKYVKPLSIRAKTAAASRLRRPRLRDLAYGTQAEEGRPSPPEVSENVPGY